MPPPGAARPDEPTYAGHRRDARERALDATAAAHPHPGRVAVHRLSRTEYANAVRDLLAIELPATALLPADEPDQQTFDNVASVLSVSPALLENYLSAAYRVSRLAVADPSAAPAVETYTVPMALVQDDRVSDDLPFGSQGGLAFRHQFPATGDYTITVTLRRQLYRYIIGHGRAAPDRRPPRRRAGAAVHDRRRGPGLTAPESFAGNTQGDPEWEVYMHTADEGLQVRVPVSAGAHDVERLVRAALLGAGRASCSRRSAGSRARPTSSITATRPWTPWPIAGPLDARAHGAPGRASPEPRRGCSSASPGAPAEEAPCARRILERLGRRAPTGGRSPTAELETLLPFYTRRPRRRRASTRAFSAASSACWPRPRFLFRVVTEPAGLSAPARSFR